MRKKNALCLVGVTGYLILALVSAMLALPGSSLADKPDQEKVFFDVTTPVDEFGNPIGDMVIDGVFVESEDGMLVSDGSGVALGGAGKSRVGVNRPSPALLMDFLADLECFELDDIYSFDGGGTLVIFDGKKGAYIQYFFRAFGKDGSIVHYRIDGDALIMPDTEGNSFPKGDPDGYTVLVDNIRVSVDTGSRKNGCKGSFPDAMAIIRIDRQP